MDTIALGPSPFYRTRNLALLREYEWGWSTDPTEAWIFDDWDAGASGTYENCAHKHIAALAAEDRQHSFPVVVGLDAAIESERARRHRDQVLAAESSVRRHLSPQTVYEQTAKRLGEHE